MWGVSWTIACYWPFKNNNLSTAEFCWVNCGFVNWVANIWLNFNKEFRLLVSNFVAVFGFHFPNNFALPNAWFCQTQVFWFLVIGRFFELGCGDVYVPNMIQVGDYWIDLFSHSSICWYEQQLFEFNHVFSGLLVVIRLISYSTGLPAMLWLDCCWLFSLFCSSFFCSFFWISGRKLSCVVGTHRSCVKTQSPMITISADR